MAEAGFAPVPSGGTTDRGLWEASGLGKDPWQWDQEEEGREVGLWPSMVAGWMGVAETQWWGVTGGDGVGERPHSRRALLSLRVMRNPSGE